MTQLITAVSRAATDPTQWAVCVAEVSTVLGGAAVLLTLRPPRRGDTGCVAAAGIAPEFIRSYVETFYACDPWVQRMSACPAGISFGYELVPRWELLRSEFYRTWMVPQELLPELSIAGLILKRGARPQSTFAAFRRRSGRMLRLEDIALLRRLLPHLQQAVRSTRRRQRNTE